MSLTEQIRSETTPERALEAVFDLTQTERRSYAAIVDADRPVTAPRLAAAIDCAETSAYRHLSALDECGLVQRATADFEGTGRSAYVATPPDEVADRMADRVEETYEECRETIDACRPAFAGESTDRSA
ncbi:helix-turn-helix domain-containing protein [Halococcoides cellulosivorans]|uniref:helix-turn-helix domain-containing protein n=1 Tax=Halococcoides cellulosivorans TaxID=1679096 RepID=UPI00131F2435|nr:helix-turn-helix domain-containing protein [Halococcoides cellulosivorans]